MISFEDRSEFLMLRDILEFFRFPSKYKLPKNTGVLLDTIPNAESGSEIITHAKTQQNSLFLRAHKNEKGGVNKMSLEQFIPLPDIETGPDHGYNQAENAFEEMRTPIFLIVFIGVLLVQIFYR